MGDSKKPFYILDASVIVKWVLKDEADVKIAKRLKDDFANEEIEIGIPSFSYAEIINGIIKKRPALAITFLSQLLAFNMSEYRITLELASRAVAIIKRFENLSFYDAFYHALALVSGGTFVTADEKYYKKTSSLGRVMLLKDYKGV